MPGADIHPSVLAAAPKAPVVVKEFADGFEQTNLEETLAKLGVTDLPDCCTTVSEILHLIALHAVSTRVKLVPSSVAA